MCGRFVISQNLGIIRQMQHARTTSSERDDGGAGVVDECGSPDLSRAAAA